MRKSLTEDVRILFETASQRLCDFLRTEMSTFDTLSFKNEENRSFLFKLTSKLKDFDRSTIANFLKSNVEAYENILDSPALKAEANIREGRIFSKKVHKKNVDVATERRRRQSFAATSYADFEIILTTESVKGMSDLNILFSMNAFFLPYCGSSKQRSMYESFFHTLVTEVHKQEKPCPTFMILQESIMIIQTISEAWMNTIELLLGLLQLAYLRVKTHNAVMRCDAKSSVLHEESSCSSESVSELINFLNSEDKVFRMIRTGKLLNVEGRANSIPKLEIESEPWLSKLQSHLDSLEASNELDEITLSSSVEILSHFDGPGLDFVGELRAYLETFRVFKESLKSKNGVFDAFVKITTNMFKSFEFEEKELSSRFDSPRKSPKSERGSYFASFFSPRVVK